VNNWQEILSEECKRDYFIKIQSFLREKRKEGITVYPKKEDLFAAFSLTPFEKIKVVILGQDPYHGMNQAHGLAFSVHDKIQIPPSLQNIFKELMRDVGNVTICEGGCLINWAKQGVLLLNSVFSVEAGHPGSHSNICWQRFSDFVIESINKEHKGIIFLLWGCICTIKRKSY